MHSLWLRITFLRVLKFLLIKEGGPNFSGETILQKVWIIWSPHLYFNFKTFMNPNSLSFFSILMHSAWIRSTFLKSFKFLQIKEVAATFWGEPILQKVWIIWPFPLDLFFNFMSFKNPNPSSLITFQSVLYDSEEHLLDFHNFYKLKWADLIS